MIERDLQDFIHGSIKSVWMLELLLFLRRHSSRAWSPEELVRELRGSDFVVDQSLAGLLAAGLVSTETSGTYRYAPAAPHIDRLAAQIEKAYRERPSAIVRMIVNAPNDKLQTFADAFKLKKD